MSQAEPTKPHEVHDAVDHDEHDDHHGHPYLAHHFNSMQQQFASAKLGMWVFLATEILMFGGLFCAYAFYRANHPDVFVWSHYFLDTNLGLINTIILLASSFTMAWGVRAAMLNQRRLLMLMLALTLLGGFGFMVIKTIEYKDKMTYDLWIGVTNAFYWQGDSENPEALGRAIEYRQTKIDAKSGDAPDVEADEQADIEADPETSPAPDDTTAPVWPPRPTDRELLSVPAEGPIGTAGIFIEEAAPAAHAADHRASFEYDDLTEREKSRVHIFFQIYFLMTGLHGIHVLIGMGLIAWILVRSWLGHFGAGYFTPVDIVGLYWHLVDLIWIFLFPLLYLIH